MEPDFIWLSVIAFKLLQLDPSIFYTGLIQCRVPGGGAYPSFHWDESLWFVA